MFLCLFLFAQIDKTEKNESMVLPFIKLDAVGTNPLNDTEKIIFKKSCTNRLVQEFQSAPVYLVSYRENKEKKIEILYEQIGLASCVFKADDWVSASIKLKINAPSNHVLRAKTKATKSKMDGKVLMVEEVGITEFYLIPKETAVAFE